jgi:methylmalonyl-CoA mutase cobalamin-binding subunit
MTPNGGSSIAVSASGPRPKILVAVLTVDAHARGSLVRMRGLEPPLRELEPESA